MYNIVIVGTGGLAAEVTGYIKNNHNHFKNYEYSLKGYIDISQANYEKYRFSAPFLGNEIDYVPESTDCFLIAIGLPQARKKVIHTLMKKNAVFISFIHYTCCINESASLGVGNIIAPYSIIGPNVQIGDFNIFNCYSLIAHDCRIGNYNIVSPNCMLLGASSAGDNNFIGTSVIFYPETTLGSNSKIQAGLAVKGKLKDNSLYYSRLQYESIQL